MWGKPNDKTKACNIINTQQSIASEIHQNMNLGALPFNSSLYKLSSIKSRDQTKALRILTAVPCKY